MLFNSYVFIFAFLPAALVAVMLAHRFGRQAVMAVLIVASLIFYGWFVPGYIVLILASATFNYGVGLLIKRHKTETLYIALGVAANLILLGIFKYLDFAIGTANAALATNWTFVNIVLPLGVSFFTFTQIAYLVDLHRGQAKTGSFGEYLLFVTFFPHLVAGPIIHHANIIPQFRDKAFGLITAAAVTEGLTWFAIGMVKKTLIADNISPIADQIFGIAASGGHPSFFEAWFGALAFAFQIYFDFSGYSDMAIGLGLMFGVTFPLNFNAPYRSTSAIDFWRSWHMTLSRFLRDYLYIPLGGNRKGRSRLYLNLMITMLLGGLWHGAAWTFVAWGGLHGCFLAINHAWRRIDIALPAAIGWLLTMVAVCFAWVFFRAEGFGSAVKMAAGLAGMNGVVLAQDHAPLLGPLARVLTALGVTFNGLPVVHLSWFPLFAAMIAFSLLAPTTQALMNWGPSSSLRWKLAPAWSVAAGIMLAAGIAGIGHTSTFIYFQF
jgi:alginate O-acetyltransferase complex protein AlgI